MRSASPFLVGGSLQASVLHIANPRHWELYPSRSPGRHWLDLGVQGIACFFLPVVVGIRGKKQSKTQGWRPRGWHWVGDKRPGNQPGRGRQCHNVDWREDPLEALGGQPERLLAAVLVGSGRATSCVK
jgi:hypothetical protein